MSAGGQTIGSHAGSAFFTVGQRRGLGITAGGPRGRPRYVTAIEDGNTLVVGSEEELYRVGLEAGDVNWLDGPPGNPAGGGAFRAHVQIRYRSPAVPASVTLEGSQQGTNRTAVVRFDEPQRAVAPGQSAVFYAGDRVLGGGTIASALS